MSVVHCQWVTLLSEPVEVKQMRKLEDLQSVLELEQVQGPVFVCCQMGLHSIELSKQNCKIKLVFSI